MPLTTPKPQNTDNNGIDATLLFAILTKKPLRSEVTVHSFTSSCAYPQYNYVSGCFMQTHIIIININFASIIMLPGPGPGPVLCIYDS